MKAFIPPDGRSYFLYIYLYSILYIRHFQWSHCSSCRRRSRRWPAQAAHMLHSQCRQQAFIPRCYLVTPESMSPEPKSQTKNEYTTIWLYLYHEPNHRPTNINSIIKQAALEDLYRFSNDLLQVLEYNCHVNPKRIKEIEVIGNDEDCLVIEAVVTKEFANILWKLCEDALGNHRYYEENSLNYAVSNGFVCIAVYPVIEVEE